MIILLKNITQDIVCFIIVSSRVFSIDKRKLWRLTLCDGLNKLHGIFDVVLRFDIRLFSILEDSEKSEKKTDED